MYNLLFAVSLIIFALALLFFYSLVIKPAQDAKDKERNRLQNWMEADKIIAEVFTKRQAADPDFDCGG